MAAATYPATDDVLPQRARCRRDACTTMLAHPLWRRRLACGSCGRRQPGLRLASGEYVTSVRKEALSFGPRATVGNTGSTQVCGGQMQIGCKKLQGLHTPRYSSRSNCSPRLAPLSMAAGDSK